MKLIEKIATCAGISAMLVVAFYLLTAGEYRIILMEPIWWIRIPEIIIYITSSIILLKLLFFKCGDNK